MTAARIVFGWRCVKCHAQGIGPTWAETQACLDGHWQTAHGRPMPEQDELGEWEA